jgi:hypothetical protein
LTDKLVVKSNNPFSNETHHYDITEILLKVALNIQNSITKKPDLLLIFYFSLVTSMVNNKNNKTQTITIIKVNKLAHNSYLNHFTLYTVGKT